MIRRKSIHVCFSLKKGRSDMTPYLECTIMLYQYMKYDDYQIFAI